MPMHAFDRRFALAARHRAERAFTLIELMVVIAVIGIVLVLAGPPMIDMLGMQRMKAVNSQLVSDFQFARSEAVSRNQFVGVSFRNVSTEPMSCYVIFASSTDPLNYNALDPTQCNCTQPPGSACSGNMREIRTVQVPREQGLQLRVHSLQPKWFAFVPLTGGMRNKPANTLEVAGFEFCAEVTRSPRGRLRSGVNLSGRPSTCSPDSSVTGVPSCAAYSVAERNCRLLP